jgi:hypothetical protein
MIRISIPPAAFDAIRTRLSRRRYEPEFASVSEGAKLP